MTMTTTKGRRLTASAALSLVREHRQARAAPTRSILREQRLLRRALDRLGKRLARVTTHDVEALLAARLRVVKPATVARELAALRVMFRVLVDRRRLPADPTAGLRVQPGAQRQIVLAGAHVERLLAEASRAPAARRSSRVRQALALRNRAALELLYGLGLRAGEACGTRLIDLDLVGRWLTARRTKGAGSIAALPLTDAVVPHLQRYVQDGRPALLARRDATQGALLVTERGAALRAEQLQRLVASIARRAGVEAHCHAFRRSLATHLVLNGARLPAVQCLLGHRSLDTTQRYVAVSMDELRNAVDGLAPGPLSGAGDPR